MNRTKKWTTLASALCIASATAFGVHAESKTVWSLLTGQLNNQSPEIGIVNYDLSSPETFTMVHPISSGNSLGAGVMVDGKYYWFEYVQQVYGYDSDALYVYDTEDGSVSLVKSYGGQRQGICFSSPTYDYQTQTVYALSGLMGGGDLVSVDLETGNVTKLLSFTGLLKNEEYDSEDSLKAIAVNYDGEMYGVSYWGRLYKVNKVSGECTLVGDLDFNPEKAIMYSTSLAFDNDTNELYWHVYTWVNLYKEVRRINIKDATTEQVGIFGDDRLMGDFHIPFTVASAGAPAKVSDYEVIPDPEGALGITLSWTNPTRTYGRGGTLESITKVEVYRDDELIKTFDSPAVGEAMTYHDDVAASDLYSYKVVCHNEAGQGDRYVKTIFVGQGIPMPVSDLMLAPEGYGAKLTWTAPDHGKFDAYLDLSSLVFEITRSDGVTVATDCRESEFIDNTITDLARYSYRVKAKNIGGESVEVVSDRVVCGPAVSVPHTFGFATQEEFDTWEVIDGNGDENRWTYTGWPMTGAQSTYSYFYQMPAHDYLISPKVTMKEGQHYKVTFDALPGNKNVTEILAVSFGPEPTPMAQDSVTQYEFRSDRVRTFRASLPVVDKDGDYNFGFVHRSVEENFGLTVGNIRIEEDHDGCMKGVLTCNGKPVADATVATTDGLYSAVSDADGVYTLEYLPAGTYDIIISALGFEDMTSTVEIRELETGNADYSLTALPEYAVKGRVIDAVGDAVADARVSLGGYNAYTATTAADGSFEIPEVFAHAGYSLVVERDNLMSYSTTFDLDADMDFGDITLADNLKAPHKVVASQTDEASTVRWMAPLGDPREVRYDNGILERSLGMESGNSKSIFGHVNRTPSVVYGCSFHIASTVSVTNHYSVYVYIIDLDAEGNPTDRVLYSNTYVPMTDDTWSEFTLPTPVDCPNGYMMGVAYSGFISLSIDNGEDFVPGVNCYCSDYTSGQWAYLDNTDFKANFAFRSVAAPYGGDGQPVWMPAKAPKSSDISAPQLYTFPDDYVLNVDNGPRKAVEDRIRYNVYRGVNTLDPEQTEWSQIASGLKEREYADQEWNALPQGVYRYGVKAVYAGGEESPICYADSIGRNMETTLKLTVITDTPQNEAEGAYYNLANEDGRHNYTGAFDATGILEVSPIWKGKYILSVGKEGFGLIQQELDLSSENEYALTLNLTEERQAPQNLQAVAEGEYDSDQLLVWNFPDMIEDGFEEHPDFEINSPGKYGWQYIDGDGCETGGFVGYEWPGLCEPMAFMVFNPYATEPACDVMGIYPYEGQKMLTDFAAYGSANDDWFISPRLFFNEPVRFSFYAMSLDGMNPETIQVGYSETGCEPADFIMVEESRQLDAWWNELCYDIPSSAKYVAIHCTSDEKRILMIDNVRLGHASLFDNPYYAPRRMPRAEGAYEVYLDGVKIGETSETTWQLRDMAIGRHTVGVRSVYTSGYSPLATLDIEVTSSGINTVEATDVSYILEGRTLTVTGDYTSVALYTVDGRVVLDEEGRGFHDLSGLENGVYMLVIDTPSGALSRKLQLR